jgi:putative acetyltransferase
MTHSIHIVEATSPAHQAAVRALMVEYREVALAEDYVTGGSGLNEELADFPGPYAAAKRGMLLLATRNSEPVGCLALRTHTATAGEVMRMYVKPEARGAGIAEALMRHLIAAAKNLGYRELYLDSLHRFAAAHKLYEKLGFTYCAPYSADTSEAMKETMVFMHLLLEKADA